MIYRLTRIDAPSRGGINQSVDAEIRGIAKTNDQAPFTIANEIVAVRLGQTLGLPIPAGVVAEDSSGKLYYYSLDVSKTGHTLPPVDPPAVVSSEGFLAAGCIVFDVFIANEDRHAGNLSLDPGFAPPRLSLFDHGHSLLGAANRQGHDRLVSAECRMGCLGPPNDEGNRQALVDYVGSASHIAAWIERVEQLPDYVIRDTCAAISGNFNVPADLSQELRDWLLARRGNVRTLIETSRVEFKAVATWTL